MILSLYLPSSSRVVEVIDRRIKWRFDRLIFHLVDSAHNKMSLMRALHLPGAVIDYDFLLGTLVDAIFTGQMELHFPSLNMADICT